MLLSVQLYTLRDPLQQDWEGTLRKVKGAGLDYVELAGFYDRSPEEWKTVLDQIGLKVSGGHFGLGDLNEKFDFIVNAARILDFSSIILPWLDKSEYADGWAVAAKKAEAIGQKVHDQGLSFSYHNHAFEFELENGVPGLDVFYSNCDPKLVKAQLDLAWVQHGGQDPAAYVTKYGKRVESVHLKDMKTGHESLDVIAGTGDVQWDAVLKACREAGVGVGSIEMDNPPGDAVESVKLCVDFFHAAGVR